MNAEEMIKNQPAPPALSKRVRVRGTQTAGTVFDVDAEGWIYWFADDQSCHVSRPDYLEAL